MDSRFSRNNLEDFLLYYSYYFPSRRLNKEKEAVYRFIAEKFEGDLKRKVSFDSIKVGINKVGYCVIGDLEKAENIYMAPLDTAKIVRLPKYRLYPINEKKRTKIDAYAESLDTFLAFLVIVVVYLIGSRFTGNNVLIALAALLAVILFNFLQGNRFTFSPSSAMAFISTIAANEPDDRKTAYVFIDRCADSYFGLKMFLVKHKDRCSGAKRLIYFDDLANGKELLWVSRKKRNMKITEEEIREVHLKEEYPACFETCQNLAMIITADDENGEYVVNKIRTAADKEINVSRLKKLLNAFTTIERKQDENK